MSSPVPLPSDTRSVLGEGAALCESRTLLLDCFSGVGADPGSRRTFFERVSAIPVAPHRHRAWRQFLLSELRLASANVVFGRLSSRLALNASLVQENTGLCLDRLTGIPFIPGTAVKACARRMAIQDIKEASEVRGKAQRLIEAALVFGWNRNDWLTKADFINHPDYEAAWARRQSDFAWACGPSWYDVCHEAQQHLWQRNFPAGHFSLAHWHRSMGASAGAICFLPAYPWELVAPDVEYDIVSNHHPVYYQNSKGEKTARDTEEPQVAMFPVIAPGQLFAFALATDLQPMGRAAVPDHSGSTERLEEAAALSANELLRTTAEWLRRGLATFGLGARASAGFGWFDTSETLQQTWRARIQQEQTALRQEIETAARKLREEVESQAAAARAAQLKELSPEELLDYELAQLTEVQFWGKVQHFAKHLDKHEKVAVIRALQSERNMIWEELKQRARKGGQWAQIEQAIRMAARQFKLDKMP